MKSCKVISDANIVHPLNKVNCFKKKYSWQSSTQQLWLLTLLGGTRRLVSNDYNGQFCLILFDWWWVSVINAENGMCKIINLLNSIFFISPSTDIHLQNHRSSKHVCRFLNKFKCFWHYYTHFYTNYLRHYFYTLYNQYSMIKIRFPRE